MIEAFVATLRRAAAVGDASVAALTRIVEERSFGAGAFLLEAGQRAEWSYFLFHGLVREFYVSETGEAHTRSFIAENGLTGSLVDLLSGQPAITWIQALEPTRTLAFRHREFEALCARFADLQNLARRHAEALYVRKARREHQMLALPAKARHAAWLAENAQLDPRVRRNLLASYLGITPEHLSRLRSAAVRKSTPRAGRRQGSR